MQPDSCFDRVLFSGVKLGNGAYGEVCKASMPCAAKLIHGVLMRPELPRNRERFEQECRILRECVHPNVVQCLGVSSHPGGHTALLMELMDETLTQFLEVRHNNRDVPYYMQVNISHDIANGVRFLHSRSIIHRDLSSNNVLLRGAEFTAKISDFGMSLLEDLRQSRLTGCPGTPVYMPPEAIGDVAHYSEKIDCFQMGVLMLQIATKEYPKPTARCIRRDNPLVACGFLEVPVPEKERRKNHLQLLIGKDHPMLDCLISDCLEDKEEKRPSAQCVYEHLSRLKTDRRYLRDCEEHFVSPRNLNETQLGNGHSSGEGTSKQMAALEQENCRLQQMERDLHRKLSENESRCVESERQIEVYKHQVSSLNQQLHQSKVLTEQNQRHHAEEIGRYKARIDGMKQSQQWQVDQEVTQSRERISSLVEQLEEKNQQLQQMGQELQHTSQQLVQKERQLLEKGQELERFVANHTCRVITAHARSLTANHPAHIVVELLGSDGSACTVTLNTPLTAVISHPDSDPIVCGIKPLEKRFEVSYEPSYPGQHQLSIKLSNKKIHELALAVYPDPRPPNGLVPKKFIANLKKPYGITISWRRELLICESNGNKVSVYDIDVPGKEKRSFGGADLMLKPRGVATDEAGNVYITSEHKLQKFSSETYEILKSIGSLKGGQNEEFHFPSGLVVYRNEVCVCDQHNNRIRAFNLDLNDTRTIADGLDFPNDVAFDRQGRMFVAEHGKKRVQVMTAEGANYKPLQVIGQAQDLKPEAVHIVNEYLYVSDFSREHRVAVFHTSGDYVRSLGKRGYGEGKWFDPRGIASCQGKIYVCGSDDGHIHVL